MGRLEPSEPRSAICQLCTEVMPVTELTEHLRLMHSETDWVPDHWPDGQPVIHEDLDMKLKDLLE